MLLFQLLRIHHSTPPHITYTPGSEIPHLLCCARTSKENLFFSIFLLTAERTKKIATTPYATSHPARALSLRHYSKNRRKNNSRATAEEVLDGMITKKNATTIQSSSIEKNHLIDYQRRRRHPGRILVIIYRTSFYETRFEFRGCQTLL